MKIKVVFFAMCREVTQCDQVEISLFEKADMAQFWETITEEFPELSKFKTSSRLAVNHMYVKDSWNLKDGDEICIIPPVSGG